jgi:outer membrane protein OmpA-like peptidoglycan-associated protein
VTAVQSLAAASESSQAGHGYNFSQIPVHTKTPARLQAKLTVNTPDDIYELEADRIADQVMAAPTHSQVNTAPPHIQLFRSQGDEGPLIDAPNSVDRVLANSGRPLEPELRQDMEHRFGYDFSRVRVHSGAAAEQSAREVSAHAYTVGHNIVFGAGQFAPGTHEGRRLVAHELTHVVQQSNSKGIPASHNHGRHSMPAIASSASQQVQRRLIVSGGNEARVIEYLNLVGTAAGLRLNWTFGQPRVTVGGNLPGPVPSSEGRANILRVINHPTQHAELHIGTNQPRVAVGAFPAAPSRIQNIDIDDIRNLNVSLPGQGTAKAFHEMMENFNAHGIGFGNFPASHAVGVEAESNVLEDQGIVGRRLGGGIPSTVIPAPAGQPVGPNITYRRQLQNFTHYFLEMIQRVTTGSPTGPGADFEVVSARRIPKIQVSQRTIDGFASGGAAIPPAGNVTLATALADLNGNPNSTLLIEGFADSVGSGTANRELSRNRAAAAQAFFIANGIAADRIAIVGRGETNFVATNANEAGRRQNRRIQLTVHRPGP